MNRRSGNSIIIIGSAPNALVDLTAVPKEGPFDYMAVGMDAVDITAYPLRYVVTYHPEDIKEIHRRRAQCGGNSDFIVVSHEKREGVDRVVKHHPPSGSSSLLAAWTAIEDGYDRIVLCGCPLDGKNIKGKEYASFRKGWEFHKEGLKGRVRSMSGWTALFLGVPTEGWLLRKDNELPS